MGHCSAITGEPGLKRTESSLHWYSVGLVSVFYYYVGPNLLGPTVIRVVDFGSCWHAHVWCLVSLSPGLLLSHETPGLRLSVAFPSHTSHTRFEIFSNSTGQVHAFLKQNFNTPLFYFPSNSTSTQKFMPTSVSLEFNGSKRLKVAFSVVTTLLAPPFMAP